MSRVTKKLLVSPVSNPKMDHRFCSRTGRPHAQLQGWTTKCPSCHVILQSTPLDAVEIDRHQTLPSSDKHTLQRSHPIIDLVNEPGALPSAETRFPSLSSNSSIVESHRQSSIAKAQKLRTKGLHAGSNTISSQGKATKCVPIPEKIKISIVVGTSDLNKSFTSIGW